jgi:hypothetical protein
MTAFLACVNSHPFFSALFMSVVIGIPVTWVWSNALHRALKKDYADSRQHWIGITFGILERCLLTTFILWLPQAAGPFVGAWIAVKAVTGWGDLDQKTEKGRARFAVTLMGSLGSILWAVGWGVWGMPPHSN